jgi:hypothetical protein
MNKEFIDRVARALYEGSNEFDDEDVVDLMQSCGIDPGSSSSLVATCTWVCAEDDMDVDEFDFLEKTVSEERMLELENGARLTPEEEYLARKDYCDYEIGHGHFTATHYYRVKDSQGRPIFFSSDHGDGGYLHDADGPWKKMPDMTGGFDGECLREWTTFRDRVLSEEQSGPLLRDDSELAASLTKGSRVRHPQFGSGTVTELSGVGSDVRATIDFDTVGRKRVVVRTANMERESD